MLFGVYDAAHPSVKPPILESLFSTTGILGNRHSFEEVAACEMTFSLLSYINIGKVSCPNVSHTFWSVRVLLAPCILFHSRLLVKFSAHMSANRQETVIQHVSSL